MFQILAILAGLITVYLIYQAIKPLIETTQVTAEDMQLVEDESMALLTRRDRLVEELKELEFEAALNKIDARDLKVLKARFEREAMEVYARLDKASEAYQSRINADVASKLKKAPAEKQPSADDQEAAEAQAGAQEAVAQKQPAQKQPAAQGNEAPAEAASAEPVVPDAAPQPETMTCWSCEGERAREGAFCDLCGAPTAPPAQVECGACGTENRPGARFCKRCGTDLQSVEASA